MEDTYNLLGHALKKALGVIARQQGRGLAEVAKEAGASVVCGTSLKAGLDLDWDDPGERALVGVLDALGAVEGVSGRGHGGQKATPVGIETARRVRAQEVEQRAAEGPPVLRRGVARERLVSVEDPQMRHGRKSRSVRFSGYKRHVLRDLDTGLLRAVGVTPANARRPASRGHRRGSLSPARWRTRRTAHRPGLPFERW